MTCIRYPLSPRQVQPILFERGNEICHETVWFWSTGSVPSLPLRYGSSAFSIIIAEIMPKIHHRRSYLEVAWKGARRRASGKSLPDPAKRHKPTLADGLIARKVGGDGISNRVPGGAQKGKPMSLRIVDADTHVIKTAETFSHLREDEKHYQPVLLNPAGVDAIETQSGQRNKEYWLVDGAVGTGTRNQGYNETSAGQREMTDIPGRRNSFELFR